MVSIDLARCPCGSGLRRLRCCGLDLSTLSPPDANRHLLSLVERAVRAHGQGAIETAERLCLDILELSPGQIETLWLLSRIRLAQARGAAVEALVARIVALNPNNIAATQDIALRLLLRGALAQAEVHARNAVRIAPQDPQSHNLLGMILTEGHQPQTGEFHYRRVLELSGARDPILLANLAWCLKQQGRMEEARALYEESAAAAPQVLQTLLGWARMEEADRNFDRAAELLDRAETTSPGIPSVRLTRAVLYGRTGDYASALRVLDAIAQLRGGASDGTGALGPEELLEKGRLLDRIGRPDEAFAAFSAGKALAARLTGNSYLADHAQSLASRLRELFTEARLATLPRAERRMDVAQPIFVLGFPRSGTTLTEQILSAHPRIAAGDELPFVHEITEIMPRILSSPLGYPEALADLWMGDRYEGLDQLRDHYLQRARQRRAIVAGADFFTDKMPLNETHLGLIALIFPAAPLIHVLRHPLDVMLSVFSNHLTHGFNCASTLETAARHYVLIADLIGHYRGQMTLRYMTVRYEDLVADLEGQVRRMLEFVGVAFDPSCLRFDENRRYARTASYAQVAEKLYDRSVGRWRAYRRHLEPIIPMLQPTIERLGYGLD